MSSQEEKAVVPVSTSVETSNPLVPLQSMEVQTPETIKPTRPKFVSDKREAEIDEETTSLVAAIAENPSAVEVTSKLYELGKPAMESNTQHVALMDTRMGFVMKSITPDNPLNQNLIQIKAQLDLINPHVVSQTKGRFGGFLSRLFYSLPKGEKVMELINERKETVDQTIEGLKQHLWSERDTALSNAVQLAQLSNQLFATQEDLQLAIYQGQKIWEKLNEVRAKETDLVRQNALTYLVNDLATHVVDLQTVDQLNLQSRLGAENLVNNCRQIQTLVMRVTSVLLPSVKNALVVKAAAMQQAQLVNQGMSVSRAASDLIAQTAAGVRQTVVATAKMNSQGLIDLNKLEEACVSYEKMQEELLQVFQTSEQNARGISNKLSTMGEKMRENANRMTLARQAKDTAGV